MGSINLGTPTTLTLRTDGSTPSQHLAYEGLGLTIPDGMELPPPGEASDLTAFGVTVYGVVRVASGGVLEFLIGPIPQSPVDSIPGPGGWDDEGARVGYLAQANYLLGQGITAPVLWPGLQNFYNWAAADLAAKGWTAPGGS